MPDGRRSRSGLCLLSKAMRPARVRGRRREAGCESWVMTEDDMDQDDPAMMPVRPWNHGVPFCRLCNRYHWARDGCTQLVTIGIIKPKIEIETHEGISGGSIAVIRPDAGVVLAAENPAADVARESPAAVIPAMRAVPETPGAPVPTPRGGKRAGLGSKKRKKRSRKKVNKAHVDRVLSDAKRSLGLLGESPNTQASSSAIPGRADKPAVAPAKPPRRQTRKGGI